MSLLCVNFHYIRDNFEAPFPAIFGETPTEFKQQLEDLSKCGEFISQKDLVTHVLEDKSLPEKAILITFDDGLKEQMHLALPILDAMNIPAVFYASSAPTFEKQAANVHLFHTLRSQIKPDVIEEKVYEFCALHTIDITAVTPKVAAEQHPYDDPSTQRFKFIFNNCIPSQLQRQMLTDLMIYLDLNEATYCKDLYMSLSDWQELAARSYLGFHGHTHSALAVLDENTLKQEFDKYFHWCSEAKIEGLSGISYPYGSRSSASLKVAEIAQNYGLVYGVTMQRAVNHAVSNPMFMARYGSNDAPGGKRSILPSQGLFDQTENVSWFQ